MVSSQATVAHQASGNVKITVHSHQTWNPANVGLITLNIGFWMMFCFEEFLYLQEKGLKCVPCINFRKHLSFPDRIIAWMPETLRARNSPKYNCFDILWRQHVTSSNTYVILLSHSPSSYPCFSVVYPNFSLDECACAMYKKVTAS